MTPANLQYNALVVCVQTVTTSNGASSQASSPSIEVWNGCAETYTTAVNKGSIGQGVRPGVYGWLDTWRYNPDPNADSQVTSRQTTVRGLFGLSGQTLPPDDPPNVSPWRAVTDGPNCLDYQKFLESKGYDVKQWPTDPPDWITQG